MLLNLVTIKHNSLAKMVIVEDVIFNMIFLIKSILRVKGQTTRNMFWMEGYFLCFIVYWSNQLDRNKGSQASKVVASLVKCNISVTKCLNIGERLTQTQG